MEEQTTNQSDATMDKTGDSTAEDGCNPQPTSAGETNPAVVDAHSESGKNSNMEEVNMKTKDIEAENPYTEANPNIQIIVGPGNGTQKGAFNRLVKMSKCAEPTTSAFRAAKVKAGDIIQTVVGPENIGLLLKDGRVCRIGYSILPDVDLEDHEVEKKKPMPSEGSTSTSQPSRNAFGGGLDPGLPAELSGRVQRQEGTRLRRVDPADAAMQFAALSRSRAGRGRASASVFGNVFPMSGGFGGRGARRATQAVNVPEELIQRVLEILPNKSQATVRRELQRTGLDVDAAVNHLLMSDDGDEEDDGEDDGIDESARPSESFFSFGSGLVPQPREQSQMQVDARDEFVEVDPTGLGERLLAESSEGVSVLPSRYLLDLLGGRGGSSGNDGRSSDQGSNDSRISVTSRPASAIQRRNRTLLQQNSSSKETQSPQAEASTSHKKPSKPEPSPAFRLGEKLEFLPEISPRFTSIGGMYSSLIMLCENGKLWQWFWDKPGTTASEYPRSEILGLQDEVVSKLACSSLRATVLTATGRVATFADETVRIPKDHAKATKSDELVCLEHACQSVDGAVRNTDVSQLAVSEQVSLLLTTAGKIYWWGLLPLSARTKIVEKHDKSKKVKGEFQSLRSGDRVILRSSPLYRPGAIGFTAHTGVPCIGELLDSVWSLADKCRFRVITRSDTTATGKIEEWRMDSVLFLHQDETTQTGTILKVDGPHAAVFFPESGHDSELSIAERWEKSRLFRADELRTISGNKDVQNSLAMQDFVQNTPTRLKTNTRNYFIGIHAGEDSVSTIQTKLLKEDGGITKNDALSGAAPVEYAVYPLSTQPVDASVTLQLPIHKRIVTGQNASFLNTLGGFVGFTDDAGSIITSVPEGQTVAANIPAICSSGAGMTVATKNGKQQKVNVLGLVYKPRPISALLLEENLDDLCALLKTGANSMLSASLASEIVAERADGSRNILHLAIDLNCEQLPNLNPSAAACLSYLVNAPSLAPMRKELLMHVNDSGKTPLMAAIYSGDYASAEMLLQTSIETAKDDEEMLKSLLQPDLILGQSLLHALVSFEMCSYQGTGSSHTSQHVFECYTCSMTGSYCLCIGCAKVCHQGHDIRYKGRAPSAYCDCEEQGLCRACHPRPESAQRKALIDRLSEIDFMITAKNRDEETVLFSLVTRLPDLIDFGAQGSPVNSKNYQNEIQLRQKTLASMICNWKAVSATILIGYRMDPNKMDDSMDLEEFQDNTVLLDHFTFHLVSNHDAGTVALFIRTLNNAIAESKTNMDIVCRFVRSVVRVYTVMCSGDLVDPLQALARAEEGEDSTKDADEGAYKPDSIALIHCRAIFMALPALSLQELAENADAIISPVRIGLVRPHAPFKEEQNARNATQDSIVSYHYPVDDPDEVFSTLELGKAATPRARKLASLLRKQVSRANEDDDMPSKESDSEIPKDFQDASLTKLEWATRQYQLITRRDKRQRRGNEPQGAFGQRSAPRKDGNSGDSAVTLEQPTTTMEYLARLYTRIVKMLVDIVSSTEEDRANDSSNKSPSPLVHPMVMSDPGKAIMNQSTRVLEQQLERTWIWLASTMDSLEAQLLSGLRYTDGVPQSTEPTQAEKGTKPAAHRPQSSKPRHRRRDGLENAKGPGPLGQLNFRQYLLTLMRGHSGEHGDILPAVDVSATKHLAFALDAFMYFLRRQATRKSQNPSSDEQLFFIRSESIVEGGAIAPSNFTTPLKQALPLAVRPDRLYPTSSRSTLFGSTNVEQTVRTPPRHLALSSRLSSPSDSVLSPNLTRNHTPGSNWSNMSFAMRSASVNVLPSLVEFGPDVPAERWRIMTKLFVEMFMNDVGGEHNSFLNEMGGYKVREEKFRNTMDLVKRTLPDNSSSDLKLSNLERGRKELLSGTLKQLNSHFVKKHNEEFPFACRAVKVSFKDEPGAGSGVARSFYAAIAEALSSKGEFPSASTCSVNSHYSKNSAQTKKKNFPQLSSGQKLTSADMASIAVFPVEEQETILLDMTATIIAKHPLCKSKLQSRAVSKYLLSEMGRNSVMLYLALGEFDEESVQRAFEINPELQQDQSSESTEEDGKHKPALSSESAFDQSIPEITALFHEPGNPGFFCPLPGEWNTYRLSWFRNIGRLMGLSVLHNDIFPLTFSRSVLKFMIGRKVAWHDLAFYNPVMYESMRKAIVEAASSPTRFASWDLSFRIDLPESMGGGTADLLPDGENIPVVADNVHKYVALYAQELMVESIRPALEAMRAGILDVVPASSLSGLTAEDLRLLLNGCTAIDVNLLERCTDFADETGKSSGLMDQTKKWFWSIVHNMTPNEQHDLVFFWTSSPTLPATEAGLVPRPSVHVRPPSDGDIGMLPTANTCISRLSVPAYKSKTILQKKLLMAIRTKTFGFV
eukprot:m.87981 g.87981  ORF g.87981 m.87981 type:complete len:2384 (-) comp13135_c0_seq1:65-7216(-)